ncbi:SDR family NAD(P)-dependent oxidoreductase [Streptomyces doudnae]|uniref:SDR family NAD(P)-dependent oxidoreductase n=3 Tax=Streptomyces TaxID=1883 RepID=A0ABD5EGD1_9ACTN|nr:SDR family NAD(P)-dependent oxidoreductase [Streptomyces sp. DSM 41981]MDT0433641.1 SDR family NAD(P)-dependent oxidoreductase [Streptomyces sp. DSM 41981]
MTNAQSTTGAEEPIAVVGMAGRFPGAPDVDSLWTLLMDRREAVRPVPADRWDAALQHDPRLRVPAVGGFLDDIDLFDAGFFGISPREAAAMDPQQRLLLEVGWQALEDAGQRASDLAGTRTGVYVATVWHDYELLRRARGAGHTAHTLVGSGRDILANRLSYFMKLRGPSLAVDTGCSSGLVALDLAARALRAHDIEAALVGSANLMMDPHVSVGLTHFGGLSPDGRCASFARSANGFVRGEGVAAVCLKTLSRALRDGDRVHGVLVSTLTNNDGGGASLVSPSQEGQEDLLRRSYGPRTVPATALSYVEAHGTGTKRGDPTEAGALGTVLGRARPHGDPLPIGSVKTNIGHLEGSSGLAGLIKVLLSLRHRIVPPSLHAEELNPRIPFDDLNLTVVREPLALPAEGPVHLGVNSFGWGGTNAHVVVASPPPAPPSAPDPDRARDTALPPVVTLSGHRAPVLARRAAQLHDALPAAGHSAAALAGTLAWHRDHFAERAAFVAGDLRQAAAGLTALQDPGTPGDPDTVLVTGRAVPRGRTAFVFPGQGSQWRGMGVDLYRDSPRFAAVVDRCAKALAPHVDWDLTDVFVPGAGPLGDTWTTRTDVLQPALWAMSLGLAELWGAAGVVPDVVLGTSQGEITAATFAGALSLDDAALLLARRGALITERVSGRGLMLAVDLDREDALRALEGFEDEVSFAAHNGPRSCVLAGDRDHVLALKELLEAEGTYCALVGIDYASHSATMGVLRDDLLTALAPIRPTEGTVPLMSIVEGAIVDGTSLGPGYWVRNLCEPVEFVASAAALFDSGVTHVVEISPHPVLHPALEQQAADREEPLALLTTVRRGHAGVRDVAQALARAYTAGLEPFGTLPRHTHVPVPCYPMERESFWPADGHRPAHGAVQGLEAPLTPAPGRAGVWHGSLELSPAAQPWLPDHRLYDTALLPGTGMLALALHTALARTGTLPAALRDVRFRKEVTVGETPLRFTTEWRDTPGGGAFRLLSLPEGAPAWDAVASADVRTGPDVPAPDVPALPDWGDDAPAEDPAAFYRRCAARGQVYGPAFRTVHALRRHPSGDEALGEIRLPDDLGAGLRPRVPHPVLWDGALQVALLLDDGTAPLMPVAVDAVHLLSAGPDPVTALRSHVLRRPDGLLDVRVHDGEGRPLLVMAGLLLRPLPGTDRHGPDADRLHHLRWTDVTDTGRADRAGAPAGRWTVCDSTGGAHDLVDALRAAGAEVTTVGDLTHPQDAVTTAGGAPADHIVFLAPRARVGTDAQQRGLAHLTSLVRVCSALPALPRLTVVTDRAQSAVPDDTPDPGAALYWGYGRVLQREHPELRPRLLDIDTAGPDWAPACSLALLAAADDQLALRGDRWLAARITRTGPHDPDGDDGTCPARPAWRTGSRPHRLGAARGGPTGTAEFLPRTPPSPGPGQIVLEPTAAAVTPADLRDLAAVRAGTAPGTLPLGRACVGRISALGPGTAGLGVGDRVAAVTEGALAGHVLADAHHVVRIPEGHDDAEAAALTLPAVTARHALTHVGRLAEGDTLLVHGTALPDALAAVRAARAEGAVPLVVVDDAARHTATLRAAGAHAVLDSADPRWPAAVADATGGRGADLVLGPRGGPLAGPAWDLLAPDGRYVEDATRGGARPAPDDRPLPVGATFASVDLDALRSRRPARFARLLAEVWAPDGDRPPAAPPVRVLDCSALTGTTVDLDHAPDDPPLVLTGLDGVRNVAPEPLPGGRFRADGAYLVTGGLGALGLSLAGFLAANGAGTLVLIGRSAPTPEADARLAELRAGGTTVHVLRCDIADRGAVRQALDGLRARGLPPLRGVAHAAGVVSDATIGTLTPRQFTKVLQPKVAGTVTLEAVTAHEPLDFFLLFSSAAALVGNAGQAAYAAANAYLDATAEARRRRGLPALSVQWGPFADIGLAARDARAGARLGDRGMDAFPAGEAWAALTRLLPQDRPVVGYLPLDLRRWFEAAPDTVALSAWRDLHDRLGDDGGPATGSAFADGLRAAPPQARPALVEAKVRELAARVLRLAPERLERDALFESLGLDSLMSLELRNRLEAAFGLRLSPTLLWTYGTPRALTKALTEQITHPGEQA